MLTKNSYLEFLRCPQEFWLNFHHAPNADAEPTLEGEHRKRQGFEVLQLAKQMSIFKGAAADNVEFHKIFSTDHITTSADITVTDPATGELSIYEVNSSASVKDKHLHDVAFQKLAAEMIGYTVARTFVINVDTAYTRNGHIDPDQLLKVSDVTDRVNALHASTLASTQEAIKYLTLQPEPELKLHCGQKLDCGFIRYHFKDIPVYNVTHISHLKKERCGELIDIGVIDICDVPADFRLTERQRKQVELARSSEPVIDREAIAAELSELKYPLHFLDYETFAYPVPHFSGTRPYQQVVFQYSLHTVESPGAEPEHCFHLSRNAATLPHREIAEGLHEKMSSRMGTTIVWSDSFERKRNDDLAETCHDLADFFQHLNESIYDLRDIFSKGTYRHPAFRGGTSLKNVQPILYPEASYQTLEIGDGTTAAIRWYQMATGKLDDIQSQKTYNALCQYCHLDTLAMVKIFDHLASLGDQPADR